MTIHLSEAAHKELVPVLGDDYFVSVGKRNIKGKGTLQTYLAKVSCGSAYWHCSRHAQRQKQAYSHTGQCLGQAECLMCTPCCSMVEMQVISRHGQEAFVL